MQANSERTFYVILINSFLANVTNMTVWFAIIFYIFLKTQSVLATGIMSGIYLVSVAVTGFIFGGIVDRYRKKTVMLASSVVSLLIYVVGLLIYLSVGDAAFGNINNPVLWIFIVLLLGGVIAGNLRGIALSTLVTILIPEDHRDKANGFLGMVFGISFLIVSVISGLLVGNSGMLGVLVLSVIITSATVIHLIFLRIPEIVTPHKDKTEEEKEQARLDIAGTLKIVRSIPGLMSLIFFTTINNFLGGVFMALMDAYGLSLVSVETWGILWGILSTAFILGGIFISRFGLGKNPLRSMFIANVVIWSVSSVFTIPNSIIPMAIGMFIYLTVAPFIEAAEHTIVQKVVPPERQGRVFGFAQSVEQAASPITSFLIGPLTQFIFIPFMTDGAGARLIGSWFGTGSARGIALVFTITGVVGLMVTLLAMRTGFYKRLSERYMKKEDVHQEESNT